MLIYFKDNTKLSSRAVQIWQVLTGLAHTRRTTTYKELAGILGYKGAGVLGRQLGHIMFLCDQNKLPPLTVLVVNSETGLPGEGLEGSARKCSRTTGSVLLHPPWKTTNWLGKKPRRLAGGCSTLAIH